MEHRTAEAIYVPFLLYLLKRFLIPVQQLRLEEPCPR